MKHIAIKLALSFYIALGALVSVDEEEQMSAKIQIVAVNSAAIFAIWRLN